MSLSSSNRQLESMNPPSRHKHSVYLIVAALLGSMLLGALQINRAGFWYDEIVSAGFITNSTEWYRISPEQMPIYYLVLRGWTDSAGLSEVAGRWLSLLFGLLTLSITYRLAVRYFSRQTALLALMVLGSSAFFVRYFREMRPYMLLALACMLSMWFFLEWLNHHRYRNLALYTVFSIAALYTHYFAGLVIVVQAIYFVWQTRPLWFKRKLQIVLGQNTLLTLAAFVVISVSLIPYIQFYLSGLEFVTSGRYSVFTLTPADALSSSVYTLTNDSLAIFLFLVVLALLSRPKGIVLAALWALFPLAITLLVHTFIYQMFANPRYLIYIWPAFAILAALGIGVLPRKPLIVITATLIFIGILQVYNDLPSKLPGVLNNPPWREMFSTIGENATIDSRVIVDMVDLVGLTGYRRPMLFYFNRYLPANFPPPIELNQPPEPDPFAIKAGVQNAHEIWWIATDGATSPRGNPAREILRQLRYTECQSWQYPEQRSYLWRWDRVDGETYNFENGLRIQKQPLNTVKANYAKGATLTVFVGAYTDTPLPIDYSLGLYLINESGQLVTQRDGSLGNSRTSQWQPGVAYCDVRSLDLPNTPGKYEVKLAVYDAMSGNRLAPTATPTPNNNTVGMFSITIE